MENSSKRRITLAAVAAGAFATARGGLNIDKVTFFSFQTRDIVRAASGRLFLWGPEMTGGGNLPGGLYYWLLGVPLRLGLGWQGCWWLLCALWGATAAVLCIFLGRHFGVRSALLASLFTFLPLHILLNFLNVSAIPLFVAIGVAALLEAFSAGPPAARTRAWVLAGLVSGLGIQLHFTASAVFAAGVALQLLARPLKLAALPPKAFLAGAAAFLAPLLPFFFSSRIGVPPPASAGSSWDALPSLLALARDFWRPELPMEVAVKCLYLVPLPLVAAFAAGRAPLRDRGKILTFLALTFFVPASYYLLRPNGFRYIVPFETALLFLLAQRTAAALEDKTRTRRFMILNLGAAAVLAPFAWHGLGETQLVLLAAIPATALLAGWREYRLSAAYSSGALLLVLQGAIHFPDSLRLPMLYAGEMRAMAERVHERTGWSYAEARQRLFFVDTQMELSPELIYDEAATAGAQPSGNPPSGFFVTTKPVGPDNFRDWLLAQPLQQDLKESVREGSLQLGTPDQIDDLTLVPFTVGSHAKIPEKFGNIGYSYAGKTSSAPQPAANRLVFMWRECPLPECITGAEVQVRSAPGLVSLMVRIFGAPLEQSSEWTGPGWTQAWIAPYLEVHCGDGARKVPLFESVGINPRHSLEVSGMREVYNSFLAPIERTVESNCPGGLKEITVGRESTLLYDPRGIKVLHPAPETLPFPGRP